MLPRLTIEDVRPSTPAGMPAKAVVGERVPVSAAIYRDGHDVLAARVRWRPARTKEWRTSPLRLVEPGLDQWAGELVVDSDRRPRAPDRGVDRSLRDVAARRRDQGIGRRPGARNGRSRKARGCSTGWRSGSTSNRVRPSPRRQQGLRDTSLSFDERLTAGLDQHVASLVSAVPDPIDLTAHQVVAAVGRPSRALATAPGTRCSPVARVASTRRRSGCPTSRRWASTSCTCRPSIRSARRSARAATTRSAPVPTIRAARGRSAVADGGHLAVAPELGTIDDFDAFVDEGARQRPRSRARLRVAVLARPSLGARASRVVPPSARRLDRVRREPAEEVPGHLPDQLLARERRAIARRCGKRARRSSTTGSRTACSSSASTTRTRSRSRSGTGCIDAVRHEHPDVVFLAEAFTRPRVMSKLAEIGFSQSYTYFTWRRVASGSSRTYLNELAHGPIVDWFRPNFWPNTPDILSGPLRNGPPSAFRLRLLLAATMAPSYGIYSGYELCENEPASDANEEYLHSEKYEIKAPRLGPRGLAGAVHRARSTTSAVGTPRSASFARSRFHHIDNDDLIAYSKRSGDGGDVILCVVNLDPNGWHEATLSSTSARSGSTPVRRSRCTTR